MFLLYLAISIFIISFGFIWINIEFRRYIAKNKVYTRDLRRPKQN